MNIFKLDLAGKVLEVEIGKFAKQAHGSVMMKFGETHILATAVGSKKANNLDFFPLTVNYEEKLYAAGKIPGGFAKREGRPSEAAILAARLIDRPIRPLFPKEYKQEVQIVTSVMSIDKDYEPEVTAINGASLALMLAAHIPFEGPIGAVHVGLIDGQFIVNPTVEQRSISELELRVAGTYDAINMVEAKANELAEETVVEAILFAHEQIKKIVEFQTEIVTQLGIQKEKFVVEPDIEFNEIYEKVANDHRAQINQMMRNTNRQDRNEEISQFTSEVIADIDEEIVKKYEQVIDKIIKEEFRTLIVSEDLRPDGRHLTDIRQLTSECNLLPRVHGSSLFTRGETQVLAALSLGVKHDEQILDTFELVNEKRFMLHYNFPPYSVGEAGRMGAPSRREIGHGNLAEKAVSSILPDYEQFPYTVRIVCEVLESNGSSSQASICSSSMALMAAGVPVKKHVAGIAMGLIADEDNNYSILSDIQGLEDHLGDMDFKVAGTRDGICAIQMDIKIKGISRDILIESLAQARVGRMHILDHMYDTIAEPASQLSEYAPKVKTFMIKPSKIKDVIGRGGDTINKIIEQTGVKIDIEETGSVSIYSESYEAIEEAAKIINAIVKEYEPNEEYEAEVYRIEAFGAFVRFDGKQEALVHISDLAATRTAKVEDVVNIGDKVSIILKEIDNKGRIKAKLKFEEKNEKNSDNEGSTSK